MVEVGLSFPQRFHINARRFVVAAAITRRMAETGQSIDDGDIFIHNHPYQGASHSPDVMIAVPIFHEGEHVAWSACVAHLLDIGGSAPGINPDSIDRQRGMDITVVTTPPPRSRSPSTTSSRLASRRSVGYLAIRSAASS